MAVRERVACECGQRVAKGFERNHEAGGRHQKWLVDRFGGEGTIIAGPVVLENGDLTESPILDIPDYLKAPDFQSILQMTDPINKAKAARGAFGARGWPNSEHPGTVRDFLEEQSISYFVPSEEHNLSQTKTEFLNFVKRTTGREHEIPPGIDPNTITSL